MSKRMKVDERPERSYHHGNLRAAAVAAALEALAHKMPGEISLRELAKSIGVGHSALYAHFRDRDELFAVVSEQGFETLRAAMRAALATSEDKIAGIAAAYLRFARTNRSHYRVMYGPGNTAGPVASQIEEVCNDCLQMLVQTIREVAGVGQDEAHQRAVGVWCALHGLVLLADPAGPLRNQVSDEAEREMAKGFARVIAIHA